MNILFEEATTSQEKECLEMIQDFYLIDQYPFDHSAASINFQEFISKEHLGRFWLLRLNQEIIGYLILTFGYSFEYQGRDAFIDEFYLKEAYRGKGYGSRILEQLDDEAKSLNVNAIHLEVERTNKAGNRIYNRSGYVGNDRSLLTKVLSK